MYWRVLHLIAMVTWFSGLFYLPRLFVYHAMAKDTISLERFKIMQRKLYYGIIWPSGMITTLCGFALLHKMPDTLSLPWMQVKLACVAGLWAYHLSCGYFLKKFATNTAPYSHIFYRWFNEVPVLFLVGIIFLVIQKPLLWGPL